MYIANLVHKVANGLTHTSDWKPNTARYVTWGLTCALILTLGLIAWALLPWGAWANFIVTALGFSAILFLPDYVKHHVNSPPQAKKKNVHGGEASTQQLSETAQQQTASPSESAGDTQSLAKVETTAAGVQKDGKKEPGHSKPLPNSYPPYDPKKWASYSEYVMAMPDQVALAEAARQELIEREEKNRQRTLQQEYGSYQYWKKCPHPKWFWKRIWRMVLAFIVSCALIAADVKIKSHFNLDAQTYLAIIPVVVWFAWYCMRRYYKWSHLYLKVVGYRFIVEQPRNPWLWLFGHTQDASIVNCGDIDESQTFWESSGLFISSGKLSIDTPRKNDESSSESERNSNAPKGDLLFDLKDVRDHLALKALLQDLYDEMFAGRTSKELQQIRQVVIAQ